MHGARDLAPEVLLGGEQESRYGGRQLGELAWRRNRRRRRPRQRRPGRFDVGGQGVAVAREDPLLAVEDLDLGLHQRGALRERQELRVLLERGGRIAAAGPPVETFSAAWARRLS